MAEDDLSEFVDPFASKEFREATGNKIIDLSATPQTESSWTDYPAALGSRAAGIGADLSATVRAISEDRNADSGSKASAASAALGKFGQTLFGMLERDAKGAMTDEGRSDLDSTITDPNFWTLNSLALKTTNMAPDVIASAVPAVAFRSAAAAGIVSGTLSASQMVDDFYAQTDAMSDEELRQIPMYRDLRKQGATEEAARSSYNSFIRGNRPLWIGAFTALTNSLTPGGKIAGAFAGTAEKAVGEVAEGVVKRTVKGGAEGAISEGAQEGTQDYLTQQGEVAGQLRDKIDPSQTANAAATGAVLGTVLGAGVSAVTGGKTAAKPTPEVTPEEAIPSEVTPATPTETTPVVPSEAVGTEATIAQDMQSLKNHGKKYAEIDAAQQAEVDAKLTSRGLKTNPNAAKPVEAVAKPGVSVVEAAAPNDAQILAITKGKKKKPTAVLPTDQAVAVALPPVEQPVAAPVEQAPVQPVAAPVEQAQPVTPEVIQETPTAAQPVASEPVVAQPTQTIVEPTPAPAVAEPAMVPDAPVVAPKGPRILTDPVAEAKAAADYDAQLEKNLRGAAEADNKLMKTAAAADSPEALDIKSKISAKKRADIVANHERANKVMEAHLPADIEQGVFSTKPDRIVAGRKAMLDRATAMLAQAEKDGVAILDKLKDNTDREVAPTPAAILLAEARGLVRAAAKAKAEGKEVSKARLQEFSKREFSLRIGDAKDVLEARRVAGDAAKKVVSSDEVVGATVDEDVQELGDGAPIEDGEFTDDGDRVDTTPDDEAANTGNPEDAIIRKEEGEVASEVEGKQRPVAAKVKAMGEGEGFTTPKTDTRKAVVETKKKRVFVKPAAKEPSPAAARKLAEIKLTVAEQRVGRQIVEDAIAEDKAAKATVKERIEKARGETNTAPTQAQATAGNYKKGKVSIDGVAIAIENPKGSVRSNKDPAGPAWSVKMRHDYGYLEGTKGADGDPIDVYVGPKPDATYVYVVDQIDPFTQAFDEHKVMFGFDTQQEAVRAYDAAFSDGLGINRIGGMAQMTREEFKAWSKSAQQERSDLSTARADEMRSLMVGEPDPDVATYSVDATLAEELRREVAFTGKVRDGYVLDPLTKRFAKAVREMSVSDALWEVDLSNLAGAPRVIAGTARAQLTKLVGDMRIHIVTNADILRLSNYSPTVKLNGYHAFNAAAKDSDVIIINQDLLANPDKFRHVVLHEVTHAATVRGMVQDTTLLNNIINSANYIRDYLRKAGRQEDLDAVAYGTTGANGVTAAKEFIAEAFSNKRFQEILATIPAHEKMVEYFKLGESRKTMWGALVSAVRRALKMPDGSYNVLEVAIRLTEDAMKPRVNAVEDLENFFNARSFLGEGMAKSVGDQARRIVKDFEARQEYAPTKGNPWLIGLRTLDSIARASDRYFKGNNVVRKIANIMEGQRVAAIREFDAAAPIIQKLHSLERKYQGKVWEDFTQLVHDETMAGVYADRPLSDQKHISAKGKKDTWQRSQHPVLAKMHAALPADLKVARLEAMSYFRDKQNEVAVKLIRNRIVTLFDTTDPDGMATRLHEGKATDADKLLMSEAYDAIAAAGVLSKINGPYFPLMRRGNYVVKGKTEVTLPGNATRISDNEFEFTDADAAAEFSQSQSGRPTIRTIYVDKDTGATTGTEDGKTVRLGSNDMNAVPRYRVVVQNRHMEMFDTMKQARDRVAQLRAKGIQADDAVPRSFEAHGLQTDALSTQMRRMNTVLERRADERQFTPTQKQELLDTLNEMSINMLGSTRIQSRHLPRQYVAGASKDLVRNTTDYAHSMGNYVAKLDYRPQLDTALVELDDAVKANAADGLSAGRTAIQNEIVRRVTTANPIAENQFGNAVTKRILAVSFIDKLMSPSYSVINALQPMMTTAPYLAGHYGAGRAYAAMSKAYSDVGSLKVLKEGFIATADKVRAGRENVPTDPVNLIKSRLKNKQEIAMLDILIERGSLDVESGLEVSEMVRDKAGIIGKLDTGIGYLEGIGRQMPKAVESINRSVSALAAYRLEMQRSGNHERAVQFAQDTVNLTQFNYSATNSAPYMNHPALRLMLQFKKYGAGMYQMLGEQVAIAIRNENPGDRARAIKSLSFTIGMHVLVAGAMGLPTEPIKLLVTAANGLGITDWSWGDVEDAQREAAADLFGAKFGEIVSRGLPRAVGIDLSSRMGIDTLMGPFGQPRSNEAQDWKAYAWDAVAGAPAGLVVDWAKGINDLAEGDFQRAAERLVPVKVFADSLKAYRVATEGTVSETSGKQVMSPYSGLEAFGRAMGMAPAREAEAFERSGAFYRAKENQDAARTEFQREWVDASGAARGRLWREIRKWNKDQPAEARLTISELRGYQKRMKADMKETKEGIRARRREEHILNRADATYNFLP